MLPLPWLRPLLPLKQEIVDTEEILPSFEELQRKTWQTLYPQKQTASGVTFFEDKSPKGSVDTPIQHLVDLINHHSAVSTLSSCSGRTSLFDPNERRRSTLPQDISYSKEMEDEFGPFTDASGKGRGTWVLVSHDLLESEELVRTIFSQNDNQQTSEDDLQPWILKFEPMLLHIAARSLSVGQALLQMALECGFRESGLVVTSKRVTVAIRSHSLALSMPLVPPFIHPSSNYCPSPDYIRAITQECNQRLIQNWNQLQRLYQALELKWFQISLQPKIRVLSELPTLRLWNAATAVSSHGEDNEYSSIYTFGGYGKGPDPGTSASKRTSCIYRLQIPRKRRERRDTTKASVGPWEKVEIIPTTASDACWNGLPRIKPLLDLPVACQGMGAACLADWIVLWGGRTSPMQPLDTLYLFHPGTHQLASIEPMSLETAPTARWGHCLLPLSNQRLVLVGGGHCGEMGELKTISDPPVFEDLFILHYLREVGFVWERVDTVKILGGRLHPAATIIQGTVPETLYKQLGNDSELLLVTGGLEANRTQQNPLACFSFSPTATEASKLWACQIGATTRMSRQNGSVALSTAVSCPLNKGGTLPPLVGASLSTLMKGRISMISGGVGNAASTFATTIKGNTPLPTMEESLGAYLMRDGNEPKLVPLSLSYLGDGDGSDFSCLVHHASVSLSDTEFALIGGGVKSFAFGETFAASYHMELVLQNDFHEDKLLEKDTGIRALDLVTRLSSKSSRTMTSVVYVNPKDAKRVKTALNGLGWLNKGVRMITVQNEYGKVVAIPVRMHDWTELEKADEDWQEAILGKGQEEDMPLSTACFAAQKTKH